MINGTTKKEVIAIDDGAIIDAIGSTVSVHAHRQHSEVHHAWV